jgi:hypothetical protein
MSTLMTLIALCGSSARPPLSHESEGRTVLGDRLFNSRSRTRRSTSPSFQTASVVISARSSPVSRLSTLVTLYNMSFRSKFTKIPFTSKCTAITVSAERARRRPPDTPARFAVPLKESAPCLGVIRTTPGTSQRTSLPEVVPTSPKIAALIRPFFRHHRPHCFEIAVAAHRFGVIISSDDLSCVSPSQPLGQPPTVVLDFFAGGGRLVGRLGLADVLV